MLYIAKRMRFLKLAALAGAFIYYLFAVPSVGAIAVGAPLPSTPKTDSPIIITGYSAQGPALRYVQVFNNSGDVIDVTGWKVRYSVAGLSEPIDVVILSGMAKPGGYLAIADVSIIDNTDFGYSLSVPPSVTGDVNGMELIPREKYASHSVPVKPDAKHSHWRRNISASTGGYLSTFTAFTPDTQFVLYGNGFYSYPEATGLQVTELLANPRNCSPIETAGDCGDYVKLYNPTTASIDLSDFRLRSGYKGQNSTSSNTFLLAGTIAPGQYMTLTTASDGRPITLASGGGFVWLEDMYGLMIYESTLLEYPDAASDSKKGQAWAYDTDGIWKWTTQPTPFGGASVFPPPLPLKPKVTVGATVPCRAGQYRNEETNRCRNIANEATALAPCDEDEERNPETNRCRKLASLASQQLAPCKEGQERNAETNRCRNVTASTPAPTAFGVETVGEASKAFVGWWALGGLGILAIGYGVWEWRQEMIGAIHKVGSFFTSGK